MFYYGLNDQDNDEYLINKSIAEIEENAIGKLFIFLLFQCLTLSLKIPFSTKLFVNGIKKWHTSIVSISFLKVF